METIVDNGKNLVGIWYKPSEDEEGPAMWEKVYNFNGGVDLFYSYQPL